MYIPNSVDIKGVTSNKRCNGFIGLCFESPNDIIHVTVRHNYKKRPTMQTSIGIRVNPNQVSYCILTGTPDEFEIKQIDKIVNPKSLETPEQLKFIRSTLYDIINEDQVKLACIRITESNARQISVARIYMEGVIQELIASSTITKYFVGQISSISSRLGIEREDFKPYVNGANVFIGLENWNQLSLEEREAFMASLSALNL